MVKFLSAILLVSYVTVATAQVKVVDSVQVPKSYWLAGGAGLSSLGSVSAMLVANAEIKNRLLISANWTGETSSILDFTAKQVVDVNSFNVLAGKVYKQRNSLVSFSAGLGLIRVYTLDSRNGRSSKTEATVGLPLSVQAYAIGFQAIGVGLNLYANLNAKQSTAGVHVSLALGRMSTRPKH